MANEADGAIEYNYRKIVSSDPYTLASMEIGIKGEGDQAVGSQLLYLASRGMTLFVGDGVSTRIPRLAEAREAVWADGSFLNELKSAHLGASLTKRRADVASPSTANSRIHKGP